MDKKTSCEIILGSYEEFILGFKYEKKVEGAQQTFAVHSHQGSIRCVTTSGDLLASGGSDDRIVVYNLKTRRELCILTHHNSTVNCLHFTHEGKHLVSGSQDGTLAIVRVGNWQLEKLWEQAHKDGAVEDIAIHSSDKLMLSIGTDATLRTWNLVKGRQAYVINLNSKVKEPKHLHSVKWAPDSTRFVLVSNIYTDIWSISTGNMLKSIQHQQKIISCAWLSDEKLIVGYEDGNLGMVDVESDEIIIHEAHGSRVKCLTIYRNKLITACSTGELKVWSAKLKQLCVANAGCRFTCICTAPMNIDTQASIGDEGIELDDSEQKNTSKIIINKEYVTIEVEDEDNEKQTQTKSKKPAISRQTGKIHTQRKLSTKSLKYGDIKRKKLK